MLATVIEATDYEVIVQDETGNIFTISKGSEDFITLQGHYSEDSFFDFDPVTKKVVMTEQILDEEDYSIPDDYI